MLSQSGDNLVGHFYFVRNISLDTSTVESLESIRNGAFAFVGGAEGPYDVEIVDYH